MSSKEIVNLLSKFVEIPSISSEPARSTDLDRSANFVKDMFEELGLTSKVAKSGEGKPAVLAQTEILPSRKTVLLYAHHDVQPVGDMELWNTDPFTPEVINGRLYGRGSGDNKAGVITHYHVVKDLIKDLPINIKIFIEGEEEIGSPTMEQFIIENKKDLEADVIVIADSGNIKSGLPTVTTSLRGLVDGTIVVEQPMNAVHSGLGGGIVPDAFMILSKIISSFHNDKGELQIEGLSPTEAEVFEIPKDDIKKLLGSEEINLFETESYSKRLWLEPALSVLAIDAPGVDESINLLIPKTKAKISLRIPPTEDPEHAMNMLKVHIEKNTPWNASVKFIPESKGSGVVADPNKEFTTKLIKEFEEVWKTEPAFMGVGGSIPFANVFTDQFPDAELVLIGPGDDEGNAHAPNESVCIEDIEKLIQSLINTLKNF